MSHPNLLENPGSSAEKLKALLLSLSREPENNEFKSILRSAADRIREKAFGYNRATTKRKILKLITEFERLEVVDLTEETGIAESEIRAALDQLVADGKIVRGRRRRWQEPGKHYNDLFELAPNTATIG